MIAYASIGKEIWWVCENHIKLKIKLREHFEAVAMHYGEVSIV